MLPLRDSIFYHGPSMVSKVFIYLCAVIFFLQITGDMEGFMAGVYAYGFVPVTFWANPGGEAWRIFSSMFMHGSLIHLIGNMWFLWVFGPAVEGKLGTMRFVILYLMAGAGAALLQGAVMPASEIPMVGASGAISGVLGSYLVIYPRARILTMVPPFFFLFFWVPAFIYLGYWFFIQLLNVFSGVQGVAWWAHIGGFVVGMLLVPLIRPRRKYQADPFWECWRGYC